MTVDPGLALQLAGVLLSVVALATAALATRRKDTDARFAQIEARVADLERAVAGTPTSDDLHQLHILVTQISGQMGEITAVIGGQKDIMKRLETIVTRHEDHLLEGKR